MIGQALVLAAALGQSPRLADLLPVSTEEAVPEAAVEAVPELEPEGPRKESELAAVPALFRTPETGLGGGGAVIYIPADDGAKVSSALGGFLYTEKKQFLTALYTEQYFNSDKWVTELYFGFQHYPDSFFGVGDDTSADDEEFYTWSERRVAATMRHLFTPYFRAGLNLVHSEDDFQDLADDGQLRSGLIPGIEGGVSIGAGGSARYDTLDDGYGPTKGEVVSLTALRYAPSLGSAFDFSTTELTAKKFWALSDDDVIGAQLFSVFQAGEPPFFMLAQLGGKNLLRGYFLGRYRDRNMLVAQTEWRRRISGPFGAVLFAGAGDVARDADGFTARDLKPGGGVGLRYQLVQRQKINLRVDLGLGRGQPGPALYLYLLEAF